ncbi:hypothetical protein LTR37_010736 [Vermiconidia calcicola]|uniref:Uncharacterized protein n=1 Tax=Vermiconidia calcicola TaxID=1690605 RepID=A0ACC3N5T1_9PEZI|nr:hypothetical protein LTR37_010736 [Vermiconidia calcicola]
MRSTLNTFAVGAAALATLADSKPLAPYRLEGMKLHRRAVTEVICGLYPSADIANNGENLRNLEDKGGDVTVSANSCNRIGCFNTSGVYVCNDNDEDITIPMSEATEQMLYLMSICIGGNSIGKDAVSGRVKVDAGWNMNVGYCNGNDSPSIPPSGYGWPGPNGTPDVQCGKEDQASCEGGNCKDGSLVIQEQTVATCQSYLGASYVGPGATLIYNTNRNIAASWSVGGWIGIDSSDLVSVAGQTGFGGGFSETTTTGSTAGISDPCGPPESANNGSFTCGMHIRPQCYEMRGTCIDASNDEEVPWANVSPMVAEDGIGVYTSETCTCSNCPDSDNEDAPAVCELQCQTECLQGNDE